MTLEVPNIAELPNSKITRSSAYTRTNSRKNSPRSPWKIWSWFKRIYLWSNKVL